MSFAIIEKFAKFMAGKLSIKELIGAGPYEDCPFKKSPDLTSNRIITIKIPRKNKSSI